MKLPVELGNPKKKRLINIKTNDQQCFLWCHIGRINQVKVHPERITQNDKKLIDTLDFEGIEFPVSKYDFSKTEMKNRICINVFCYENNLTHPIHISDQKFENSMYLLLISNQYVDIKDFDRFMFNKTKNKNKKYFCKSCLQCCNSKNVLTEHKTFV